MARTRDRTRRFSHVDRDNIETTHSVARTDRETTLASYLQPSNTDQDQSLWNEMIADV